MERAGHDDELAGHAGLVEPPGVLDVLVVEDVEGSDADPRGRESGEVVPAGGRRVGRDPVTAGLLAEVGRPSEAVVPGVPHAGVPGVVVGADDGPVVEHRILEQLEHRRHLAAVVRVEGESGGETRARAGAADRDPGGVDAALCGVSEHPAEAGVGVLDGGRSLMVGREPIGSGDHGDAEFARERDARVLVLFRTADDVAAAVQPEQRGRRLDEVLRTVAAETDGCVAGRTGNPHLLDDHVVGRRGRLLLGLLQESCGARPHRDGRDEAAAGELGVERRHGSSSGQGPASSPGAVHPIRTRLSGSLPGKIHGCGSRFAGIAWTRRPECRVPGAHEQRYRNARCVDPALPDRDPSGGSR